jgi:hypothetical protein
MKQGSLTGHCLCGAVHFRLEPPIRDIIVCHCRQCATWTGSSVAATAVSTQNLHVDRGGEDVQWFSASAQAQRGFCRRCGSSLFWKPEDGSRISILAGCLDQPTGLAIAAHIFVASKADYDHICDGAPQYPEGAGAMAAVNDGR